MEARHAALLSSYTALSSALYDLHMDMGGMDMGSSSAMATATATAASAAASATSTAMSSMSMGSTDPNACKISMLWNWNTINACFITTGWHVHTKGQFAGTCIGVILWVIIMEALRRMQREYDRYLVKEWTARNGPEAMGAVDHDEESQSSMGKFGSKLTSRFVFQQRVAGKFIPSFWHQIVRASLYTVDFGASYLLMLMAMYYNGYVLISMWIGAFIGSFLFNADTASGDLTRSSPACC